MLFRVGVSCRILYSIVSYLYESCSGSITSVGEERANSSAIITCNYVVSFRSSTQSSRRLCCLLFLSIISQVV